MTKDERETAARRQFKSALDEIEATLEPVVPTEIEKRNGWTTETLTAYVAEQAASQSLRLDPHSVTRRKALPRVAKSKYRPLRWRG